MIRNIFLDIIMHERFTGHPSYVLLCTETTLQVILGLSFNNSNTYIITCTYKAWCSFPEYQGNV